jgi:non-ribosomal peptide synthetase component F
MYINRITNKSDIIIGIPVLNRRNAAEKDTVGMFISTVPIRILVENDLSFSEFSEKITRNWMTVLKHQRYPLDRILLFCVEIFSIQY